MNFLKEKASKYTHYRITFQELEVLMKKWFKEEKGIVVNFISYREEQKEQEVLGKRRMDFDYENLNDKEIEVLSNKYNEGNVLEDVLKEITGKDVEAEFKEEDESEEEIVYMYIKEEN